MRDKLDSLIWSYLDGDADAETVRQLDAVLRADARARAVFLDACALQAGVLQVFQGETPLPEPAAADAPPAAQPGVPRVSPRALRLGGLLGGALVAAAVGYRLHARLSAPDAGATAPLATAPEPAAPRAAATVRTNRVRTVSWAPQTATLCSPAGIEPPPATGKPGTPPETLRLPFADTFEQGAGRWEVFAREGSAPRAPASGDVRRLVSTVARERNGSPTRVARIRGPGAGRSVGLRLLPVTNDAFSVAYDYSMEGPERGVWNPVSLVFEPAGESRTLYWNGECHTVLPPGQWVRLRIECRRTTGEDGRRPLDVRWYQDQTLVARSLNDGGPPHLVLDVTQGAFLFDNVEIRELSDEQNEE